MGMRKILEHNIRMQKNPQTKEDTFWIFTDFHGVLRTKVQLAPPYGNFINGVSNPKIVYTLLPLLLIFFFKKTLTLNKNSLNI